MFDGNEEECLYAERVDDPSHEGAFGIQVEGGHGFVKHELGGLTKKEARERRSLFLTVPSPSPQSGVAAAASRRPCDRASTESPRIKKTFLAANGNHVKMHSPTSAGIVWQIGHQVFRFGVIFSVRTSAVDAAGP